MKNKKKKLNTKIADRWHYYCHIVHFKPKVYLGGILDLATLKGSITLTLMNIHYDILHLAVEYAVYVRCKLQSVC